VLFLTAGLLSPLLGLFLGLVVCAGAAVNVDDYISENDPDMVEPDFKVRMLRFLDAFAVSLPFSWRKKFQPSDIYRPHPGRAVALLGSGMAHPGGSPDPDKPFLRLSWSPPVRLSFWVAVSAGVLCGCFHLLLVLAAIERNPDVIEAGAGLYLLAGAAASTVGAFLLVSASAEALRWAHQRFDPDDDHAEEVPGYAAATISLSSVSRVFKGSKGSVWKRYSKILFPAAAAAAACGAGLLAAAAALFPASETQQAAAQGAPLAAAAAAAAGLLAAAGPFGKMARSGMLATYKKKKEQQLWWDEVFKAFVRSGDPLPVWTSTHNVSSGVGDLKVHMFVVNHDIANYRKMSSQIVSVLDGASGVVIEGAEPDGSSTRVVPSGVCRYLLIYETSDPQLGKAVNCPHLRLWEQPGRAGQEATPEGLFALRVAFSDALARSSMPDMLIVAARQHHATGPDWETGDGFPPPVVWEIECEYRAAPLTSYQLHQKTGLLREALRCDWFRVGKSRTAGDVRFWLGSHEPRDVELKDERNSKGKLLAVPGGAETVGASPTRVDLVEAEWQHLLSSAVKDLPAVLTIQQRCWLHPSGNQMVAEAVIGAALSEKDMDLRLAELLKATMLYSQTDKQKRRTKIVWGLNVNPQAYLSEEQPERFKAETATAAMARSWRPSKSGKEDAQAVAVVGAKIHVLSNESGSCEVTEVICSKGRSVPLENYEKSYIVRSMGNLGVKWLRVGQATAEPGTAPDPGVFSVAFSSAPNPAIYAEPGSAGERWLYTLERIWGYAEQAPEAFAMLLTDYDPLTVDGNLRRTRWELPPGVDYHRFAQLTTQTSRALAEPVMIPGLMEDDLEGVYLVSGEAIPADRGEWIDEASSEQVGRWSWEQMMLICKIRSDDNKVPALLETRSIGRTYRHVLELPVGMGSDEIIKQEKKIKSTGNFWHLEIRPETGNKVVATTAFEDPLAEVVPIPQLKPRPYAWDFIPLGVGVHIQNSTSPGYSPFTISWRLRAEPHMLVAGRTGTGKTSALLVIAAEAISRGFDLRIIDINKQCADFSGIYEYDLFCSQVGFTLDEAYKIILDAHLEVRERAAGNKQLKVGNWYDRPAAEKPRPVLLLIDECFTMLQQSPGNDEVTKAENQKKAKMTQTLGKIAREARSAGVHLLLVAQRPDAAVMPGELRSNLGSRLLLGDADHTVRDMMLTDVAHAPKLDKSNVRKGRGVFCQEGLESCLVQTFWAGKDKSEITENLRQMFTSLLKRDVRLNAVR